MTRDPIRLLERLDALTQEYGSRAAVARAKVVSWEKLTFPRSDVRPLYLERHGWAPGRRAKGGFPSYATGADASGQTVVEETHDDDVGRSDAFFDWSVNPREAVYYTRERQAEGLLLFVDRDGLVSESVYATKNGQTYERYSYVDRLAAAIRMERAEPPGWQWRHWNDVRAERADDGSLLRVTLLWPSARGAPVEEVMWERRDGKIWRRRT